MALEKKNKKKYLAKFKFEIKSLELMLEKKLLIFPSLPPSLYLRKMLKAMPCII